MKQVYLIIDKTDAHYRKPFVAIAKTLRNAEHKVANLQSRLNSSNKHLVSFQAFDVADYDMNKSSIYIIYDKTDANFHKPIVSMHFDYSNAERQLKALRSKVPLQAQKLIFTQMEPLI